MNAEFIFESTVRISDCDAFGRWRLSSILGHAQEIAEHHAASLGLSRNTMLESNICWIIYRQSVRIHTFPTCYDAFRMITWPGAVDGPLFPRYFLIERPDGARVGELVSSWLLLDVKTRKPQRPGVLPRKLPQSDREPPLPLPAMLRIQEASVIGTRSVCYSDLDMNGHMNNTRYADWVCDALGVKTMREKRLSRIQINYIAETYAEDIIELSRQETDDGVLVSGNRISDRKTVFESSVSLA